MSLSLGLGLDLSTRKPAAGGEFTPLDLFSSGQNGLWFNPSPTTLFTDTGGTTAAAVGDDVAYIQDQSGNGKHAIITTAAARPTLRQTAGGLYYLELDGVDDAFFVDDVFSASFTQAFICYAIETTSGFPFASGGRGPSLGGDSAESVGSNKSAAMAADESLRFNDGFASWDSGTFTIGAPVLHHLQMDGARYIGRQDGVQVIDVDRGSQDQRLPGVQSANNNNGVQAYNLFQLVAVEDDPTASETSDLEAYVAEKGGVTL